MLLNKNDGDWKINGRDRQDAFFQSLARGTPSPPLEVWRRSWGEEVVSAYSKRAAPLTISTHASKAFHRLAFWITHD